MVPSLRKQLESLQDIKYLLNSIAILVGIILVDLIMSFLSSGARKLLSTKLLKIVSIISSISMIGFGIYFGIQAFQALF